MTNFVKALENKIKTLNDQRREHWESIQAIDTKLELLNELYLEESGEPVTETPPPTKKRKPGRPKGSGKKKTTKKNPEPASEPTETASDKKGKFTPDFSNAYEEAVRSLSRREEGGTTPELQERLVKNFNPQPRPTHSLGPGITAGTKKQVENAAKRKIDTAISVDEDE